MPVAEHILDYARPDTKPPMMALHWIALWCGLLPLMAGTITFAGFLATRNIAFEAIGLLIIVGGVCAFVIGVICRGVFLWEARRAGADHLTEARRRSRITAWILLLNWPVAAAMTAVGVWLSPN